MKWLTGLSTAGVLGLVILVGSQAPDDEPKVEVVRLTVENFDRFAPQGKEVDAIAGDVVLRNPHLTAVIARPVESRHANMTVRQVGGGLIDLATRQNPSDQLSAFYPGRRTYPYRKWKVVTDNGDVDLNESPEGPMELTLNQGKVTVLAEGNEDRPEVEVTYTLEPDEAFLIVTSRYRNVGSKPLTFEMADDLRLDAGKEFLTKSPNGVQNVFWAHDRFWRQAYALFTPDVGIEMNSDARSSVLKYRTGPEETTVTLKPEEERQFHRWLFVGENLLDVRSAALELHGTEMEPIEFTLTSGTTPIPNAEVTLRQKGVSYGSGLTDAKGKLQTLVPPGSYDVDVSALGVKLEPSRPLKLFLVKGGGGPVQFDIPEYRPGKVVGMISDNKGQPIPAKIAFKARDGTPQPEFGPETGDFAVKNLRYTADGRFEQLLPPGTYDVIVSHGPEYDAILTSLTVLPGETTPFPARLTRSVDTRGWISADFHSHSSPSGDTTSSQLGRVLNLLAEHVEFAPCTEHNRIDSYDPHIQGLQAERFIATCPGMELTGTPLPLNHQNAFPLVRKPHAQDGGAPLTDPDPGTQIERLARWDDGSEKLVQANHPDVGWMFYDKDGDGKPDGGHEGMFAHVNALEISPVESILYPVPIRRSRTTPFSNAVFGWLQLLNQGRRYVGVANTDAHDNFHGSCWARNWIQSPTDDPAAIKPLDVVRVTKEGRVVLSNGPFLEVAASEVGKTDRVTAGGDLTATSKKVELKVRVQCPNWFDVDRVFVLVNGRVGEHNYTRKANAARFRSDGPVKFDETLTVALDADAYLVVACGGESTTFGEVLGPVFKDVQPAAFANPIAVDVDGNGFKPNGDTLGFPLPVKFVAPK